MESRRFRSGFIVIGGTAIVGRATGTRRRLLGGLLFFTSLDSPHINFNVLIVDNDIALHDNKSIEDVGDNANLFELGAITRNSIGVAGVVVTLDSNVVGAENVLIEVLSSSAILEVLGVGGVDLSIVVNANDELSSVAVNENARDVLFGNAVPQSVLITVGIHHDFIRGANHVVSMILSPSGVDFTFLEVLFSKQGVVRQSSGDAELGGNVLIGEVDGLGGSSSFGSDSLGSHGRSLGSDSTLDVFKLRVAIEEENDASDNDDVNNNGDETSLHNDILTFIF